VTCLTARTGKSLRDGFAKCLSYQTILLKLRHYRNAAVWPSANQSFAEGILLGEFQCLGKMEDPMAEFLSVLGAMALLATLYPYYTLDIMVPSITSYFRKSFTLRSVYSGEHSKK